ncbi:hypothetical protein TNCV_3901031 [Trichonephila clavipes]|nr:hypothetical protein TNCV_3901031 [Trichonephila clavipes]
MFGGLRHFKKEDSQLKMNLAPEAPQFPKTAENVVRVQDLVRLDRRLTVNEPSGLMQSLLLRRLERDDLQKCIWCAENSLRTVEHMDTVSSECLEND